MSAGKSDVVLGASSFSRRVTMTPAATGGASIHRRISTADTNDAVVKNAAGTVYAIYATNANAAIRYLKLYNKATAPTVGTDVPVMTLPIPALGSINPNILVGASFTLGIAMALTTGVADADTAVVAANEHIVHIVYA